VDCHHHQALDRIASGVIRCAWSEDGLVEAVEVPGRRFCLGVQWHPEAGDDRRLFAALVGAAGSHRR
jgi:gamma-glutamyl-gamma-aminobutyrate hydrolase PuuD